MRKIGLYCKAYPASRFRAFAGWHENVPPLLAAASADEGASNEERVPDSSENEYFYLHEDYTVTAGIFLNENVAFDRVTPEWKAFCTDVLKFEIPEYLRGLSEAAAAAG
jgi:hypothetical protein